MAAVPTIGRADRAAQSASADAHAELLYERLYDRVYGYCLYQLGTREEAEDAAQMTFFHALRGLRRGIVPRVEAAWVFAIAKNVCLERHQTRGRRRDREVLLDPATLEGASAGDEHRSEDVARLRDALTRIPKQQREAVLLREWRGLSYREIAAEMSLSVSAVEALIFRARRSLALHLSDEPETQGAGLLRGFALGPLAAALKSALAGSAAKIAVTAAALAAAAALAGSQLGGSGEPVRTRPSPAAPAPADMPPSAEPTFLRPADALAALAGASSTAAGPSRRVKNHGGGEPTPPGTPAGIVVEKAGDVLDETGQALDPVLQPLQPVLQPLEPVLKPVQSTLEPVLQAAPDLPALSQLDTELQLP